MNDFIGGNYEQTEEQIKAKKMMKVIIVILVFLLFVCIGLFAFMYYIQTTQLKINIDAKANTKLENVLIFENEKLYIPIRAFSEYVGYTSSNGGYKQYTEDATKCYVESSNEVATFELNSNKIYKISLDENNTSEYYEIQEPIKMINNQLCTTIEGVEIAFNISMEYNKQSNKVNIFTLPYLVTYYKSQFKNSAISNEESSFNNQKALLYNMIIVKNADEHYGVYSLEGKEILGTKYSNIKFIESTKEFIVTTLEKKVGIMASDSTTKITPEYDDIKQIDKNNGLYLATNNNKQGVINSNGSIIVYLEYDQVGVNTTNYNNDIQNPYLLYDNCIPVKLNNKWGFFDKTGKKITEIVYDDIGCSTKGTTNKNATSVLLIPNYNGIVVKDENLYGVIDEQGKEILPIAFSSIYSITSEGKVTYYMIYQNQVMNVISYIEEQIKNSKQTNNSSTTNSEQSNENEQNTIDNEQVIENTQNEINNNQINQNIENDNTLQTNTQIVQNNITEQT